MFGKNPVRSYEKTDGQCLWVQEIFYTLQGEGPFLGYPAVFVRLGGCNLRCFWCDTDFESSTWQPSLDELFVEIEKIRPKSCNLIVLTGGEPMRQTIVPLVKRLIKHGLTVQIETNGTIWQELPNDEKCIVVCSPKTPKIHTEMANRVDYFKYVLTSDNISADDGLPVMSTQVPGEYAKLYRPPQGMQTPIYITPCDENEVEVDDKESVLQNLPLVVNTALKYGYYASIQLHKLAKIS